MVAVCSAGMPLPHRPVGMPATPDQLTPHQKKVKRREQKLKEKQLELEVPITF